MFGRELYVYVATVTDEAFSAFFSLYQILPTYMHSYYSNLYLFHLF
jgi:hypothetical protein